MTYMKFRTTETPGKDFVMAKLFAGPSFEDNAYCGTLVLPPDDWEKLLDVLVYGASQLTWGDDHVEIFFAPDDGGEE